MVKEHFLLMQGEMVRGILEDRKIQTRRIGDRYKDWKKGDRIWIKETYWQLGWFEASPNESGDGMISEFVPYNDDIVYYTDSLNKPYDHYCPPQTKKEGCYLQDWHKRPSIFMPREYSRITLEIINIRVERVQEISTDDCIKEGIELKSMQGLYQCAYISLWDSLNAKRGYGWSTNPWVFVIEFKWLNRAGVSGGD